MFEGGRYCALPMESRDRLVSSRHEAELLSFTKLGIVCGVEGGANSRDQICEVQNPV